MEADLKIQTDVCAVKICQHKRAYQVSPVQLIFLLPQLIHRSIERKDFDKLYYM